VLAHAGVGSRRSCEELILQGRVTVDGQVVRELGTRVKPGQKIAVDGQKVHEERFVYYAVHKPKGYVSTNKDPAGKPLVVDLLPEIPQRVYCVGRLDEQSTGLMLLTNDGELANRLAHPKFGVEKIYRVVVAGEPSREVLNQLTQGIWLAEGKVRAKRVKLVGRKGNAAIMEMVLAEGKNREIRRMLARLGHKVMSLTRIAIGPIGLKGLGVGEFRPLSAHDIDLLNQTAAGVYIPPPTSPDRRPRIPRPAGGAARPRPQAGTGPATPPPHAGANRPPGPGRAASAGPPPQGRRPAAGQASRPPRPAGPGQTGSRPAGPYQAGPPRPAGPRPAGPHPAGGPYQAGPRPAGPGRPPRPPAAGGPPPRPPQGPSRRPAPPAIAGGPPSPSPRSKRPPLPTGQPPTRRIIGLEPEPGPGRGGPPGPRARRPAPRRAPRAALGVKRPPRTDEGGA
jgi:23S rRNA pseudouridine2605 synthase